MHGDLLLALLELVTAKGFAQNHLLDFTRSGMRYFVNKFNSFGQLPICDLALEVGQNILPTDL